MSRIGKQPVALAAGTEFTDQGTHYELKGSKGILTVPTFENVRVTREGDALVLECEDEVSRNFYGLLRTLLANAAHGVNAGWERQLELHGVGMRASLSGTSLTLNLGFSHPVTVEPPAGITFSVNKNVVTVSGINKQLVGEVAAKIRRLRKPEPYKGKGIRYNDEYVRRKAGKTGKAAK